MKKLLLKLLSTICVFVLSLNVFIACSENVPNSNNSGDNSETNQEEGVKEENPYANYSPILQKVLNDNMYNGDSWRYTNDPNYRQLAIYDPVPYGFLETKGYNILDIKENRVKHLTQVYIKETEPNKLYIDCKVEHISTINYYANYVLKYDITDKEIKELNFLYAGRYITGEFYSYCQAHQFIQELSYQKTPILVTESYISVEAFEDMQSSVINKKPFYIVSNSITLLSIEDASNKYPPMYGNTHYIFTFEIKSTYKDGSLGVIKMLSTDGAFKIEGDKKILIGAINNIYENSWLDYYNTNKIKITNYRKMSNLVNELINVLNYPGVLESELK